MNGNSSSVAFLYGTAFGRFLTQLILKSHADRLAARFLGTRLSRPFIGWYAGRNNIPLTAEQKKSFRSYQEFFIRTRPDVPMDVAPDHLISPCDGWLSAFPIREDSSFAIKGSRYRLEDLLQDGELARSFHGGDCLIFRLCPTDYHHYWYVDDGWQGENHYIPGVLHSVQPIACETYPVYTLNARCWTLLTTEHFGPVVQIEVGALMVGGIVNDQENAQMRKGTEMGHFELAGSTIVLLLQKNRVRLLPALREKLNSGEEVRVEQGMHVATAL